ncbi:MAG: phage tail protein [Ectothiorhodospiraceae bacterium]|nr:phage tail protein [Ectothiorhodospiraceae bacterium]MCH8502910.1 gpW family protein [Ectothiorhodospiraceae bacterium]
MDYSSLKCLPAETLKQRLQEALDAQHRLMLGDQDVSVTTRDGRRVQYTEANASKLQQYINALQQALDARKGRVRRGPIYLGVC